MISIPMTSRSARMSAPQILSGMTAGKPHLINSSLKTAIRAGEMKIAKGLRCPFQTSLIRLTILSTTPQLLELVNSVAPSNGGGSCENSAASRIAFRS